MSELRTGEDEGGLSQLSQFHMCVWAGLAREKEESLRREERLQGEKNSRGRARSSQYKHPVSTQTRSSETHRHGVTEAAIAVQDGGRGTIELNAANTR